MKSWFRLIGLTVSLITVSNVGAFPLSSNELEQSLPPRDRQTQLANDPSIILDGLEFTTSRPGWLAVSEEPGDDSRGVLDQDDRVPMTSNKYPWSAIGQVITVMPDSYGVCTGTLVAADIVLLRRALYSEHFLLASP